MSQRGWASGNSLAIIIRGTGKRLARSFDGDSSAAPLLRVEFSTTPPVQVSVPNVVGLTRAVAETSITGANLSVGTVTTESSEDVTAGNVIRQNPLSGTSLPVGSSVNL